MRELVEGRLCTPTAQEQLHIQLDQLVLDDQRDADRLHHGAGPGAGKVLDEQDRQFVGHDLSVAIRVRDVEEVGRTSPTWAMMRAQRAAGPGSGSNAGNDHGPNTSTRSKEKRPKLFSRK